MDAQSVISFWFEELKPKDWWSKSESTDQLIKDRFLKLHESAMACELYRWRESPEGRLAEIIVLDQFSRNMFRDDPRSFASDGLALSLVQVAVQCGADLKLPIEHRKFLYMPYMHSESALIHEEAIKVFSQPGLESELDFEKRHKVIIDRFGRYPHRNQILGRESTKEEIEFLKGPGSSF